MPLTKEELQALSTELGDQTSKEIKKQLDGHDARVKELAQEIVDKKGNISEDTFTTFKNETTTLIADITKKVEKQGTTMAELGVKLGDAEAGTKSLPELLVEDQKELQQIFETGGQGRKSYMLRINSKGKLVAARHSDVAKTTGVHATVNDIPAGALASISQSLDSATLLRVGGNSPIISQYRNTPWLFDLCNLINASFDGSMPFAMWFEEKVKAGSSAEVAEGASKPLVQYLYELKSSTYKKEASLISFTEEFNLDFARLYDDILGKGRTDLINRVNSNILPDVRNRATAYNTGANFKGAGVVADANEFDAMVAMAAQVGNATFGASANTALMSSFKKGRIGILKDNQGSYLNPPAVLSGVSFVGNPDMGDEEVIVGDFKQYNIVLRGGLIVRVGYNGTDFAENKFSTVMEQFYFNYISSIRQKAIVKGPDFADVIGAIAA